MTDFSPEHDELASAYLDGDASEEERHRVESDPTLLARVEELRAVQAALAAPVEGPTAAQRDAAIRAALSVANVSDLDVARSRRLVRIASIAAAVLVVLGLAGVLIRAVTDKSETKFETVAGQLPTTTVLAPGADRAGGGQAASGATAPSAFSVNGRETLGSFADRSSLTGAAQTRVHGLTSAKAESSVPTSGAATDAVAPACLVPQPPDTVNETYGAVATLAGRPVQVDVFTIADGSLVLVVTDSTTCVQVFSQSV